MASKEKILEETHAMLRAVLISSPNGVVLQQLQSDYRLITGKNIPFKELGYSNLEKFLGNIPSVATTLMGPDGRLIVKGVASNADKHVAKLIAKQKKPRVRKSAKLLMAKKSQEIKAPNLKRKPSTWSRASIPRPQKTLPPRMKRSVGLNGNTKVSSQTALSVQKRKDNKQLSVCISPKNKDRAVFTTNDVKVSNRSNSIPILQDADVVKWIENAISKAPNGLWETRLSVLFKEKFNNLSPDELIEELKFRPDIVRIDEPVTGRRLLYPSLKKNVSRKASTDDKEFKLLYKPPSTGSSVAVFVTHINTPSSFYVSQTDFITESLNNDIQEKYKSTLFSMDATHSISPGDVYCAQFTEDKNFYRACVLDVVDSENVKVLYVDFGNTEILPVVKLRVLIDQFKVPPIQAYECCLDGVQPHDKTDQWNDEAINMFEKLTCDQELNMTIHNIDGKVLSVTLTDVITQKNVGEEMKKCGVAVSNKNLETTSSSSSSSLSSSSGFGPETLLNHKNNGNPYRLRLMKSSKSPGIVDLPEESFVDVLVCNITGTYSVFLRLIGDEYSEKLERLHESMISYYSDIKEKITSDPMVGDLFAMFSDVQWCRVKVLKIKNDKISVYFVDHGETILTTKDELRHLPSQFTKLPFQAFQCALNGLPKTKNPDVVDKLKNLILYEVAVAEIIQRTKDLVFIELIDTRSDANIVINQIVAKLVIPDEELKPVLPKVGLTTDVDITYISPEGFVFVHVSMAGSKRLEEVNNDLNEYYTSKRSKANEFVSKPSIGKICCAKCQEDGNWYRAKILAVNDKNEVEVLYVDYGNTETLSVTNLREPMQDNPHVLSLPFQALECQLYDVPKECWNDDIIDKILEYAQQNKLCAEVLSDEDKPVLSLMVQEENLNGQHNTHRLASLLGLTADSQEYNTEGSRESLSNLKSNSNDKNNQDQMNEEALITVMDEKANSLQEYQKTVTVENQAVQVTPSVLAAQNLLCKVLKLNEGWFDVFVSCVENPDKFTIQLFENDPEISALSMNMNKFYENELSDNDLTVEEGGVYAVLNDDDGWYRALVEYIIPDRKAYILFLDYGDHATVDWDDIRDLDEKFLELPIQGVSCKLEGVAATKKKWSKSAIKNFRYLIFERYIVARVTSTHRDYHYDDVVSLELCDTEDPTLDVFIAPKFIENNSDVVEKKKNNELT